MARCSFAKVENLSMADISVFRCCTPRDDTCTDMHHRIVIRVFESEQHQTAEHSLKRPRIEQINDFMLLITYIIAKPVSAAVAYVEIQKSFPQDSPNAYTLVVVFSSDHLTVSRLSQMIV